MTTVTGRSKQFPPARGVHDYQATPAMPAWNFWYHITATTYWPMAPRRPAAPSAPAITAKTSRETTRIPAASNFQAAGLCYAAQSLFEKFLKHR